MLNNLDNETYHISFEADLDWGFNVMLVTPNGGGGESLYKCTPSNFFLIFSP